MKVRITIRANPPFDAVLAKRNLDGRPIANGFLRHEKLTSVDEERSLPERQQSNYDECMNVVLIGYRASGKSTIGRLIAQKLSMEFVDIDHEIMACYDNKSVADIWSEFGEPRYRETECDVTELACKRDNVVIALGGGTPMQERAFTAIAEAKHTLRVFLEASAEVLYERSQVDTANTANRPTFSAERSGLEEVEHMLSKRQPVYRQLADHTIDVEKYSFEQAANEITKHLE